MAFFKIGESGSPRSEASIDVSNNRNEMPQAVVEDGEPDICIEVKTDAVRGGRSKLFLSNQEALDLIKDLAGLIRVPDNSKRL